MGRIMPHHNCDTCEALFINGLLCHEHGCPTVRKRERDYELALQDADDCSTEELEAAAEIYDREVR